MMATQQDWHAPIPQSTGDKIAVAWEVLTALLSPSSWERDDFTRRSLTAPFRRRP